MKLIPRKVKALFAAPEINQLKREVRRLRAQKQVLQEKLTLAEKRK